VETVVKAASEPETGEFLVPLTSERINAMRTELEKLEPEDLNEGFLTTIDAWMNKVSQDGMDGMVVILQKVLQIMQERSSLVLVFVFRPMWERHLLGRIRR
jgi:hypothetical protein